MADTKISALTDGASAQLTTDRIPVARTPYAAGDNRYLTPEYIRTATGGALAGTKETLATGAVTSSTPIATWSQTWNAGAVAFKGFQLVITDTASAAGSLAVEVLGGASGTTSLMAVTKGGLVQAGDGATLGGTANTAFFRDVGGAASIGIGGSGVLAITSSQLKMQDGTATAPAYSFSNVTNVGMYDPLVADTLGLGGAGFNYGKATVGGASTRYEWQKSVTSIADNTFTDVFTVTVPNAAHSASIRVRLTGSAGAGGSIGANESTQDAEYMINVARTAGVNAVATIGAVVGQAAAATVTGGNNIAVSAQLSAISGAVGAANTFTIQVKIARAAGTATNHTCLAFAELLNANNAGVTIS